MGLNGQGRSGEPTNVSLILDGMFVKYMIVIMYFMFNEVIREYWMVGFC